MLAKFKQFVDEITAENSRNYKISVLEKYKNDEDILYLLDFLYNPYIVTGISAKKLNKKFENFDKILEENFDKRILTTEGETYVLKGLLGYLQVHNTGTDTDIKMVQQYRYLWFSENAELFDKIVTKNLPLGIDAKTINKVIPGLIPEFNVQLSNKYFDKPEVVEGKEFALTTKIDGSRIIAMKNNGEVSFWTRQGQKYIGLVDLENELKKIPEDNFVLDGELVAIETSLEDTYKNTMKLSRTKDEEKHGLKMLVFDCMSVKEFKEQKSNYPYGVRRAHLDNLFKPLETAYYGGDWQNSVFQCGGAYYGVEYNFRYFEKLPILYKGIDTSKIVKILDEQVNKGEEGIMINICDAPYVFGRTNNLLKVKKMQTLDLEVIGFEEGTNSNQGTLGALLVRYKDNNIVKVGSGFEKALRDEIWNNQKAWLGRIIEVQYFEETENANGGKSIRFPVYKDYRTDKTEADY